LRRVAFQRATAMAALLEKLGCLALDGGGTVEIDGRRPLVVVVGGGYGGRNVAKELDSDCDVVLVDRKDYFLHNIGILRAMAVRGYADRVLVPYSGLLTNGVVVQAHVEKIEPDAVWCHGVDAPIRFDFLVIATGTSYALPANVALPLRSEAKQLFDAELAILEKSKHVLVAGGGPVGFELAGEIKSQHPQKQVTLVQAGAALISSTMHQKFRESSQQKLEALGVDIVLDQVVSWDKACVAPSERTDASESDAARRLAALLPPCEDVWAQRMLTGERHFPTSANETGIKADLGFLCARARVNSSSYLNSFPVNKLGQLKVNEYLQVEGLRNVFAIGDCSNVDEAKLAAHAMVHSRIAAHNIKALCRAKDVERAKLKKHLPGGASKMVVPVGATQGVAGDGVKVITKDAVVSKMKSNDLYCQGAWDVLGFTSLQEVMEAAEHESSDEQRNALQAALARLNLPVALVSAPVYRAVDGHT